MRTCLAVSVVQQQYKEKDISRKEEDDTKRLASLSTADVDVPSPVKTAETDDATLSCEDDLKKENVMTDDDLKKSQKESEQNDVMMKSVKPLVGGESPVSVQGSDVVCQFEKTEAVTSAAVISPQQSGM